VTAVVLQPAGAVAAGKLAQALALGARVLELRGSFDEGLAAARELAARGTHALVNSVNPHRLEGQKTAAFEIVEELGRVPDVLALPYGGGGNVTAYARGFAEEGAGSPRLVAGEAASRATTTASAIRISEPAHAATAAAAITASDGAVVSLADQAILDAWRSLAREEGVFCEPASAAGLAALGSVELPPGATVVCVITGHGLKDPDSAGRLGPQPQLVDPDPDAIEAASR
jgi:threonine synthase